MYFSCTCVSVSVGVRLEKEYCVTEKTMDGQVIYYLNTNLMIWIKLSVYLANK